MVALFLSLVQDICHVLVSRCARAEKKNNSDSCQMPISIIGYFSDMRHLTTTSFIEKSTAKVRSRSQYRKTCLLFTRKIRRGLSGLANDAKIESFIKNSFHKYRLTSTIAFFW